MMIDADTSRAELECAIIGDAGLYASFDEQRLLDGHYTDDELRDGIIGWIIAGDECASA